MRIKNKQTRGPSYRLSIVIQPDGATSPVRQVYTEGEPRNRGTVQIANQGDYVFSVYVSRNKSGRTIGKYQVEKLEGNKLTVVDDQEEKVSAYGLLKTNAQAYDYISEDAKPYDSNFLPEGCGWDGVSLKKRRTLGKHNLGAKDQYQSFFKSISQGAWNILWSLITRSDANDIPTNWDEVSASGSDFSKEVESAYRKCNEGAVIWTRDNKVKLLHDSKIHIGHNVLKALVFKKNEGDTNPGGISWTLFVR